MKKVIGLLLVLMLILNYCFAIEYEDIDFIYTTRVNEIRSTPNTDISNRQGKVYYLSLDGDDSNDGLSETTAWKTISKLNKEFDKYKIKPGDTILFRRGDVFRGNVVVRADDILLGSYGDENLLKPEICVSPVDGAKKGEWTEIDTNVWSYTINGENPFKEDVGLIWCYTDEDVYYTQKIMTLKDYDEKNIDLKSLLKKDLEFYQTGHACFSDACATGLYMYSIGNPSERFNEIEFSIAKPGIRVWNITDLKADNLTVKYAGVHGIASGTVANMTVTNCEFGYIGGAIQKYETTKVVRYGNAIEVYGSVTSKNGYEVDTGYVIDNNYVYQVYDAGLTFQLTTEEASPVENVIFSNNVIDYCNYSIEYWNNCTSKDEEVQAGTYINNYEIKNNIMRNSGMGVCTTRLDKNQSAHIKTWKHNQDNLVTRKYVIEDNILDNSAEHVFYLYAVNEESLPILRNNKIYNKEYVPFGYFYTSKKSLIPYNVDSLNEKFQENSFEYIPVIYEVGDIDKNGVINENDASIVLDKYNKNNATPEDVLMGDMDGNGVLNGTDASLILDKYNKGL